MQQDMEMPPMAGGMYAQAILQNWLFIMQLSEEFTVNRLSGEFDEDVCRLYVAKMSRLWKELKVKVYGRADFGELEAEFFSFETLCNNPSGFFPTSTDDDGKEVFAPDGNEIYRLENVLREVIERLHVTEF